MEQNIHDQISTLSISEKKILYVLGKMHISVNKNVHEKTIKKKLPEKYSKEVKKDLKKLLNSGILIRYRPHNYGLSKKGRILADKIVKQKRKNTYNCLDKILYIYNI